MFLIRDYNYERVEEMTKKYIIGPDMNTNGIFAGNKFPRDIITICREEGYEPIYVAEGYPRRDSWRYIFDWKNLQRIEPNSISIFIDQVCPRITRKMVYSTLKRKNVTIIPLLEDIDPLRSSEMTSSKKERELDRLHQAKYIISQNKKESKLLDDMGFDVPKIELNVLDFLSTKIDNSPKTKDSKWKVCYGGNLTEQQSGFLEKIKESDSVEYYVYGKGEVSEKLPKGAFYKGSFSSENCVGNLEGNWGLVWNGQSLEIDPTDKKSIYYNYVSPHKFSMYLLCGMPLIVYSGSAMTEFVLKNKCGIIVDNIDQIPEKLALISNEDYQELHQNALMIAKKVSSGGFTREALTKLEKLDQG